MRLLCNSGSRAATWQHWIGLTASLYRKTPSNSACLPTLSLLAPRGRERCSQRLAGDSLDAVGGKGAAPGVTGGRRRVGASKIRRQEEERWRMRDSPVGGEEESFKGPRPSVGDPDPTTEVACTHRGCRRPWRWGRGRRLADLAPQSIGISNSRSQSIRGLGSSIGDFGPTLEVSGVLYGCRQPWWWGRDHRPAA
ncbi:hypothetical protein CRG98_016988 [Punica granatum]|uniref:Uncharacterized protein n=1 Tax=Punica granatum TaxID=22663 RepID=A0A2I0K4D4_PUNGR|nr:hypothetical protein CRG98_016988 [Punica granatum]